MTERWTQAKTARAMQVGERGKLYFAAVSWDTKTLDLDGQVFGEGVRTPTCDIWRTQEHVWFVVRPDMAQMIYNERHPAATRVYDPNHNRNMARFLRAAIVRGQYEDGRIDETSALQLLQGCLTPGKEDSRIDDSELLHMSVVEIEHRLGLS